MAGLGGDDQLGVWRLALPVGQLLGAGVDQQGDRVGPVGAAGQLTGDLAQQRGAGGAALAVDERLAAGRRRQKVLDAEALAPCGRSADGGVCGAGVRTQTQRMRRLPARPSAPARRQAPARPASVCAPLSRRDRAAGAGARRRSRPPSRAGRSRRLRGGRSREERSPPSGFPAITVGQLRDQLVAGQHPVALHAGLGGKRVQLGEVLGLKFGLIHRAAGYCSGWRSRR